jgi:predicted ester cyclase
MSRATISEAAKAVVRRNTEEVQGSGNFDVFEELFADNFIDHTPQPDMTPDKAGVRKLYGYIRAAFPDFHAEIHWQLADGDRVTTYKTYYGTYEGAFLGVAPTLHARFTSRLLTSCVSRTAESPTTGESAIFCRSRADAEG